MKELKRLFDTIDHQFAQFPRHDMLNTKINGVWKNYSTAEVKELVDKLSAGLLQLGISGNDFTDEGADKIAIISNNRPEWLITDMAVQQIGAVLVPLYPTTNASEVQFILNDAQVKYIFVSNLEMYEKIKEIQVFTPSLKNIFSFDDVPDADHYTTILSAVNKEWLEKVNDIKSSIPETHLATLIYTSGTTGTPKGVMLTHRNICTNLLNGKTSFPFSDAPQDRVLSFLPLNHIFERLVSYIYIYSGIAIYYAESLETIGDNLREIKPYGFTTVPRLLEKVFEKIMHAGEQLSGFKRKLFFWSVALAEKYDDAGPGNIWYNVQLAIANKLIFSKWRKALGGNVKFIVTGGAACQVKLLRIFNAARIPVYEGYGPTENSPVITVNQLAKGGHRIGTVGPVIVGQQVKLEPDGEICVKGPSVMKGYYKRQDLTAETIIDGWLHTGDIGVWVDNKFLKITDRKKELFKTSGGKYVAPQPIENKLKENSLIEQALIVGAEKKFVGALIVPSFLNLKNWMQQQGISFSTNEEAINNKQVLQHFKDIVEEINPSFNHVEQVKKFELLPKEWSIETGEMTPKMSLKRKIIMEKFKDAIERIYE